MQVNPLPENPTIAVIVPTIRPELFGNEFMPKWRDLFLKHRVILFVVQDGDNPTITIYHHSTGERDTIELRAMTQAHQDIFYNRTDAIRNFGFAFAKLRYNPDIYISLDDDVSPILGDDPIQDHIDAFRTTHKLDWENTHYFYRMRGLPYMQKQYYPLLSHGVWEGVPDFDAINQLQYPEIRDLDFPAKAIPKNTFFPVCAMNMAFRKELLPWAYQAPMGIRTLEETGRLYDRFADIWGGVTMKYAIDHLFNNACAVSGFATIYHERASDVFVNLRKEAAGMELNELMEYITYSPTIDDIYSHPENDIHFSHRSAKNDHDKQYLINYQKRLKEWQTLIQD